LHRRAELRGNQESSHRASAVVSSIDAANCAAHHSVMAVTAIQYSDKREIDSAAMLALYRANQWSSAEKPALLHQALLNSHSLVTAWDGPKLVGLGNAISDGFLVVYYPHLLVLPEYQRRGIGAEIMRRLITHYHGFHQHLVIADGRAVEFYRECGFTSAGKTEPMWIYAGHDHD